MHTSSWLVSFPFFFSKPAMELTAKWHVCKHKRHDTNVRLSILRRKPFEGNQSKTGNITKFKCQQAAAYVQDPRAECSPSHSFLQASSQTQSPSLTALWGVLHYTTPQPLLLAAFLMVSSLPVLRIDQICGISAISAFSKSGFMLVFIGTACSKILDSFRTFVHDFRLSEIICWATESSFRWIFSIVFTLRFN